MLSYTLSSADSRLTYMYIHSQYIWHFEASTILGTMIKTWEFIQSSPSKSLKLTLPAVSTRFLKALFFTSLFPLCQVTRTTELVYLLHITTPERQLFIAPYQKSCILTHCISTHISEDETNFSRLTHSKKLHGRYMRLMCVSPSID